MMNVTIVETDKLCTNGLVAAKCAVKQKFEQFGENKAIREYHIFEPGPLIIKRGKQLGCAAYQKFEFRYYECHTQRFLYVGRSLSTYVYNMLLYIWLRYDKKAEKQIKSTVYDM